MIKPSNKIEIGDSKQLLLPVHDPQIITSPAEVNYHRKVTLKDADIDTNTKGQLETMYKDYDDIFSKHVTDIGKTDVVQMPPHPSTQGQYKTFKANTVYIAPKKPCMGKTRTDRLGKGGNNFPIYFKFCKSGYYSS